MSEQAAFLTDWVLPNVGVRQWVISFPIQLRYLMARDSQLLTTVLGVASAPSRDLSGSAPSGLGLKRASRAP